MSRLGKTIISLVSAGLVAVAGILLYVLWPAITGTINKNKYYTAEDVQTSYDKGFDDGNKSETELTAEITYYKTLVDDYEAEVNSLNKELGDLISVKSQNEATISNLTAIKNENESTIDNLQSSIDKNNTEIDNYKSQISSLNIQITTLQNLNTNQQAEINNLRNQIANYQTMINQLQNTNDMNIQTINTLNNQITSLNKQISELQFELNNNSGNVVELKQTIAELEKSIAYYESYIAELENETQVVATFEFDGSVYNIQIVNKGSNVSVVEPVSTGKIVFNGWTVDGEFVDLASYPITTNTKFIADITYRNEVVFSSIGEDIKTEYVENGNYATAPEVVRNGYEFDGWTVDGINIVDTSTYEINKDTTFVAVYTKLHTVSFVYEDGVVSTQEVRNGEYADFVNIDDTTYKQFNGWTINGAIVDISNYKISSSTVFTASITYSYDVIFVVDGEIYNSQLVVENNFVLVPINPEKDSYNFDGWELNGEITDLTTLRITSNTTLVAVFTYSPYGLFNDEGVMTMSWNDIVENNYVTVSEDGVLSQGTNTERTTMEGHLKIPKNIIKTQAASSLSYGAFYNCNKLESVEFSNGFEDLGNYTFYGCTKLIDVKFPDTTHTLRSNSFSDTGFIGFKIPDSVTTLGGSLFAYTYDFKYLYIPKSVTTIGIGQETMYGMYDNDDGSVVFCEASEKPEGWYNYFNYRGKDEPSTVVWGCSNYSFNQNSDYCFVGNQKVFMGHRDRNVENLVIDDDVQIIAPYAMYRYTALKTVEYPTSLVDVKEFAFYKCTALSNVYLGEYVETIGAEAFNGCKVIETVHINSPIKNMYSLAFYETKGVVYLTDILDWLTIQFSNLQANPGYGSGIIYLNNELLTDLTIPDSITILNDYVFYSNDSLKNVYAHENVKRIGRQAFAYSTTLKTFYMADGVSFIAQEAFEYCTALTDVRLSRSLKSLGLNIFEKCTSLRRIFIPSNIVTINQSTIANSPFYNSNVSIYCEHTEQPSGFNSYWNKSSTSSYFSTYWGYTYEQYLEKTGALY